MRSLRSRSGRGRPARSGSRARRWLVRLVVTLVVLVVVLALALGGLVATLALRAVPQRSGTLAIAGLRADATVRRDANGIAYIEASNTHDLFLAQGYVHAQDRLWQMEVLRHIAAGRVAELFGASEAETDAFIRTLGWRQSTEADWAVASPELQAILEAYADGVNAFIDANGGRGLGFAITGVLGGSGLGYTPEPWTALDSLGYAKLQAWNLGGNMASEIWRLLADAQLGDPGQTDELFPAYRDGERPLIAAEEDGRGTGSTPVGGSTAGASAASPADGSALDARSAAGLRALATTATRLLARAGISGGTGLATDRGIGSNDWVVAPGKSTSGHALLANDPHLGYGNPPIWYLDALRCVPVRPACPYDVAGVSFPGVPGVVLGHNATIAWGVTNVGPDVQDLAKLQLVDDGRYRDLDGTVRAFETREERLCFDRACADASTMTVRTTTQGPVISDVDERLADASAVYAVRWTAIDAPETLLDSFFQVSRASTIAEFRKALSIYGTPSQNFVYAGPDGIAYQTPGRIPIRADRSALGLRPAADATGQWVGTIPYELLPRVTNPPSGFIVTANNAVVRADDPRYLGWEFDPGDRAARILADLQEAASTGGVSLDELAAVQVDSRADRVQGILAALDPEGQRAALASDPAAGALLDALAAWDGTCGVESTGCAAYAALELRLTANIVGDELGELASDWIGSGDSWVMLERWLAEPTESHWWDDVRTTAKETRDEVIARALGGAARDLAAANGGSGIPAWGAIHTLRFEEQTLGRSGIAPIEALFDHGPYPAPGISGAPENLYYDAGRAVVEVATADDATAADAVRIDLRKAFAVRAGPSYRLAVDVGDWDGAKVIIPSGQSGSRFDPHDGDLIARFLGRQWLAFPFSEAAVRAAATETLTLTP